MIFTIGSMYFVSGSYPMNNKAVDEALSDADGTQKDNCVTEAAVLGAQANKAVFSPVHA